MTNKVRMPKRAAAIMIWMGYAARSPADFEGDTLA